MLRPLPEGKWWDYEVDNTSTTIHIPEVLDSCLNDLGDRLDQTKSDLVRNALMLHVHGRYQFDRMVEAKQWRIRRRGPPLEDDRKFNLMEIDSSQPTLEDSLRKDYITAFGKSTIELKVWMPQLLKDQLSRLARDTSLPLGDYMRRTLTAYYLGRTLLDPLLHGAKRG